MYVYLREEGTIRFRIFGPASYSECQAWLKRLKIHPRKASIGSDKLLPEAYDCDKTPQIE